MALSEKGAERKAAAEAKAREIARQSSMEELVTDECHKIKEAAPNINVMCDDDPIKPDMVVPAGADCEMAQEAAEKIGITVLCDDDSN